MHKDRYCFKVKHINWQHIRRNKRDSMGSSITKENKVEDSFFVEQESSSSQTEQLSPRRLYCNTYMEIQATDKFEEGCLH